MSCVKILKDDGARHNAISRHDRSILVEAGAGSGKTALMAGRIAVMLAQGVAPRAIAAVTFTELAASELLARVRDFVADLAAGHIAPELAVGLPDGLSQAQRDNLIAATAAIDEITCSTIHGFCQHLIKPYPAEADIDPGAAVMDRNQADLAFIEIVDNWLRERLSGDHGGILAEMVLHSPGETVALMHKIAEALRRRRSLTAPAAMPLADHLGAFRQAADDLSAFMQSNGVSEPETEVYAERLSEMAVALPTLAEVAAPMRLPLKLVMCGIGKTLDEIIGSHLSASRAITPFELAPISYDARWAIVTNAAAKLGFEVDRDFLIRISQISDGFPYYVHLIAENLLWEIFDHQKTSKAASSDDFHKAISRAIERAESPLREAYNYAIQKTTNSVDYEEALWSVAESTHLERQIKDIYERSYMPIMDHRKPKGRKPLDIEKFRTRLYRLCDQAHGGIIVRKRNSWYAFKENVLRGYVRLVAERNGVALGADHF